MDKEFEQDALEIQEEQMEEATEETMEDQFLKNQELMEAYGAPEPEEKISPAAFLTKAAFNEDIDPVRATFLTPEELGRPAFTIRFMMKMKSISKYYLDDMCKQLKVPNKIAGYFGEDINNTSKSGQSNKGVLINLAVTRKVDATKRRVRTSSLHNLKGNKGGDSDN